MRHPAWRASGPKHIPRLGLAVAFTLFVASTVDDLRLSDGGFWEILVLLSGCAAVIVAGWLPIVAIALVWTTLLLAWQTGLVAAIVLPLWLSTALICAITPRWVRWAHAVSVTIACCALTMRNTSLSQAAGVWGPLLLVFTAAAVGEVTHWALEAHSRARAAEAQRRRQDAEHARQVARAREEERSELARSLHDVVASQLTVVATTVAAAKASDDAQRWREALDVVGSATEAALVEMRDLLRVLDHRSAATHTQAETPPSVRVSQLAAMATRLNHAVQLELDADALDTAPGRQANAIVRVVRESLTNAMRYAGSGIIVVTIGTQQGQLYVRVATPAPHQGIASGNPTGSGRGLAGLSTTVGDAGGSLSAGPGPDGHWAVEASFGDPSPSAHP